MTVNEFELVADFFTATVEKTQKNIESFIELAWELACSEYEAERFSDCFEKMLSVVGEEDVLSYIADAKVAFDESNLADILGKIPAHCCEPLLRMISENSIAGGLENSINFNKVLLKFIEMQSKESTLDYEQKVKSIIRCMNGELVKRDQEIARLKELFIEQTDPEKVLDQLKDPLISFETHVSSTIRKNYKEAQRLIQIDKDIRRTLFDFFRIDYCISSQLWETQTPVSYDPSVHKLTDKPAEMGSPLSVWVLSPGFSLRRDNGNDVTILALVCPAENSEKPKNAEKKAPAKKHKNEKVMEIL